MRLSTVAPLLAFVGMASVAMAASNPLDRRAGSLGSTQTLVQYFQKIDQDIEALSHAETSASAGPPDISGAEGLLVTLGQDLELATAAAKEYTDLLPDQEVSQIASILYESVARVQNVTAGIKAGKPLFDKYNFSNLIVIILQGLEAQFSELNAAVVPHLQKKDLNTVSAMISDLICLMDDAANYLVPNSALTNSPYCSYYGSPKSGATYKDYESCEVKPFKSIPNTPKGWTDCKSSCTNYFEYAYSQGCFDNYSKCQSITWCAKPSHHPVVPQTWTPPQSYCKTHMPSHPKVHQPTYNTPKKSHPKVHKPTYNTPKKSHPKVHKPTYNVPTSNGGYPSASKDEGKNVNPPTDNYGS